MEIELLDGILNRQMSVEQIEVLDELLLALKKIENADIDEAFKAESANHSVFDVCYEADEVNLIARVEEAFPSFEGIIEQLNYEDYMTDHDVYNSIEEEQEAKRTLVAKINAWKDSVDLFIENIDDRY